MKHTTLKDISKVLNLSISAVSKALKGSADISDSTRKTVLGMAKKMNYFPNLNAINLKTQQTKTIGVIIPSILNQFFSKVLIGIIEEAEKHGYLVITLQSNEKFELEKKQLQLVMQKQVDGILISLSNQTNRCNHIDSIIQNGVPIVMFDKINKLVKCSKIFIDDKQAAYNAVTYLIEKGYRRIAHFRGSLTPQNSIDRFLGYRKALLDNGIEFDSSLVFLCENNDDFSDGFNNTQKLLKEKIDIDAIFAVTDLVAVGIIDCLKKNNIKIPDDIAVFGFSDWFMSSIITPTLSTIQQPGFEMGKMATETLIKEIENKNSKASSSIENIVLSTSLVIRNST